jgi:sugar/nucleoside kinase (ribokinase family)
MRLGLRDSADKIVPNWRRIGGFGRLPFDWRLRQIRERKKITYALVGGIYLDIGLYPVTLSELREGEFSGLGSVRMDIGGSAAWVGHYLYKMTNGGQRSFLFSRLGDDAFSKDLRQRLGNEQWVEKFHQSAAAFSQCGLSVNLEQPVNRPSTTLTHRGSLSSFEWPQILADLDRCTKRGGVIYISGYFRTNLGKDMRNALEALPDQTIVCIDHGRFQPEDYTSVGAALTNAFATGLIDIYLCKETEFRDFAGRAGVATSRERSLVELVKSCEERQILPLFTIISGDPSSATLTAHVAYEGNVEQVELTHEASRTQGRVGTQNAFNAGFLHALGNGSPDSDARSAVIDSVHHALESWATTMQHMTPHH